MITRADIVAEALTWIDTPYQHQAMLKGVGCDCIGLIGGVALACNVQGASDWARDPRFKGYGRLPDPKPLLQACNEYLIAIPHQRAALGDILLLGWSEMPQHFTLISRESPRYILHSYISARRVVENIVDTTWQSRIRGAYRFRGIA